MGVWPQVYEMAKGGEVDEPLILLLEANQQQARNAGAAPAAEVSKQASKPHRQTEGADGPAVGGWVACLWWWWCSCSTSY